VGQFDPEQANYLALGQRNAEIIELFERFCGNVRVEVTGGTGMLEAATGLPLGQRAFRCAYASGGSIMSGMILEDLAVDFYEENCRGCGDRLRSGLLGETIATVADARRSDQDALAHQEAAAAADRQRQRDERASRRARRSAGEPYQSVTQLQYVDKLDTADGSPAESDVQWLVRTASLGPEVVSDAAVAELVELAGDPQVAWGSREAAQAVLVPLTTAGRVPATATAPVALANLAEGAGTQAGRLLVAAADGVSAESVTGNVARSVIELAGQTSDPIARATSRFTGGAVVADPAPLLLCAERNLEEVVRAAELMLASAAAAGPPVALVGPDGHPFTSPATPPGFPDEADRSRSIAAAACLPLIEAKPAAAQRLVEALARSLESPDHDKYDAPPSSEIGKTLGLGLLRRYDDVSAPFLESAHRITAEARKELFGAVSSALHAAGEAGQPDNSARLIQLAVDRLQGDWGESAATEAALELREQGRYHPERLTGHANGLVGALVVEITRPVPSASALAVPQDVLAGLHALGRRQSRQTRISCLQSAVGYLVQAGADDAVKAVFSLLDSDDNCSDDAVGVRAAATRLLGSIGSRPVHLPAVVPRLYTGLLHTEPRIRRAAVRSWEELAGRPQPLPSTLLDLLPALLMDSHAVLATLKLVERLDIPLDRRPELLKLVMGVARTVHDTALDDPGPAVEACTGALLSLARGLPDQEAEGPAILALVVADKLSAYDLRDLLLSWLPPRVANSSAFAQRALSALAAPEFTGAFSDRDYRVQAALLNCPYGIGRQPLDRFLAVADLYLPDRPWPALEMIEILQRAARWADAAEVARHISAAIPHDPEHQPRLDLADVITGIAVGEAGLEATVPAVPAAPARSSNALDAILGRFAAVADARRALREASRPQPSQSLTALAGRLEEAAKAVQPAASPASALVTEAAWAAWASILRCTAQLLLWDAATQDASGDADRHVRAARRQAEIVLAGLPAGAAGDPLVQRASLLAAQIVSVQDPGEIAGLAGQLMSVPLPLRVIDEGRRWAFRPPAPAEEDGQRTAPTVGICRLDGVLVTNAHVLRPDEVHDLGLEIRLTEWPDDATALEVTFLSVLSPDQARLPSFAFPRVPPDEDGVFRLSASGSLSVSFTLPAGAPPLAFPAAARFTGPGLDEVLPVAGHSELRLRPFDATTDALTRRPQLDERIVEMYSRLHGMDLNQDDVQAFCRLYTAIVDKAVDMQFERSYMKKGGGVSERSFHDDLFDRLLADPALEGRVQRGTRAAGGFLDIIHDRINAELKVARTTAVTVETSQRYLGQAADYAADTPVPNCPSWSCST
jgi:hypothetical protein